MALINLQTNLKSLKYGDFGSERPYILKDINNPPNEKGLEKATTHRIDDLKRFRKFLTSGKGVKWLSNQGALNVVEAQIKTRSDGNSRSFAGQILSGAWSTAKLVASTTAQIPVNGTGTHFVEGFGGRTGYLKGVQGHVLARNGGFIPTRGIIEKTITPEEGPASAINVGSKILGKYLQPGAIKVFDKKQNAYLDNPDAPKGKNLFQTIFGGGNVTPSKLEYRANDIIDEPGLSYGGHSVNAISKAKSNRNAQGFQANSDLITVRPLVSASLNEFPAKLQQEMDFESEFYSSKDLIKFNIKTVSPRSSNEDGPLITRMDFRAYIDTFTDSYNGEWSSTNYIGRAEELYSYNGFKRNIQFGFKVVAHSQRELLPLYNKLNRLVGSTAPNYMNQNYMRGTFNMVTIGDYLINMPGIFQTISLTWNTDYPWQTAANEEGDGSELPTILAVQISFQPIHRNAPTNDMTFIGEGSGNFDANIDPLNPAMTTVVVSN